MERWPPGLALAGANARLGARPSPAVGEAEPPNGPKGDAQGATPRQLLADARPQALSASSYPAEGRPARSRDL